MLKYLQTGLIAIIFIFPVTLPAQDIAQPGPRDRCPVCGMFVAPYPDWVAVLEFNNGERLFFDGCKDMFRYYLQLPGQGDKSKSEVVHLYVTEYYRTRQAAAQEVFYVIGSDVYGPMGKELIPVAGRTAAETFMRDHQGRAVLSFDDITLDILPVD